MLQCCCDVLYSSWCYFLILFLLSCFLMHILFCFSLFQKLYFCKVSHKSFTFNVYVWTPHEANFFTKWESFDKRIKPFDVKVSKQHLKVFIHRLQSWTDLLACFKIHEKALILQFVETQNKQSWGNKGGRKQVGMQLRITNIVIWGSKTEDKKAQQSLK